MNGEMRPGIILRHHLPRGQRTRHPTAMQRLCQPKPTVLDDPPVGETIQRQMATGLLIRSVIFMRLGGCGDVVELGLGVLNCFIIRNLYNTTKKSKTL